MSGVNRDIVILPDIQYPYHDPKFTNALIRFVADFAPDELVQIGDLIDQPEPSRWNKGMAGEYAGTLQASLKGTTLMLTQFRDALGAGKPFRVKAGNHDERVDTYVRRYAPALDGIEALEMPALLGLAELGIEWEPKPFVVAPGWVAAHGHEGSLNRVAGSTALGIARKLGMSVVCGHTHRIGLQHETTGFGRKLKIIAGFEVGHAMDMSKAQYLPTGVASWQQGFGILRVRNGKTHAQPVTVNNRSFTVDGYVYTF